MNINMSNSSIAKIEQDINTLLNKIKTTSSSNTKSLKPDIELLLKDLETIKPTIKSMDEANSHQHQLIRLQSIIENVYRDDLRNQINMEETISGSLHDVKTNYTSKYLQYLANFFLAVLIICLILFFYFNKNSGLFSTGLVLISCLMLLYLGVKYLNTHVYQFYITI